MLDFCFNVIPFARFIVEFRKEKFPYSIGNSQKEHKLCSICSNTSNSIETFFETRSGISKLGFFIGNGEQQWLFFSLATTWQPTLGLKPFYMIAFGISSNNIHSFSIVELKINWLIIMRPEEYKMKRKEHIFVMGNFAVEKHIANAIVFLSFFLFLCFV